MSTIADTGGGQETQWRLVLHVRRSYFFYVVTRSVPEDGA